MKKNIAVEYYFFVILVLLSASSVGYSATMTDYCHTPPFIGTGGEPNILILNDASGSMTYEAYSYGDTDNDHDGILDHYNASTGYEGYFNPAKSYAPDVNGIYEEKVPSGTPCTTTCSAHSCVKNKNSCANGSDYGGGTGSWGCSAHNKTYGCCTAISTSGDCDLESGNYLNYFNMHRIDLLRWALTGGRPATCEGSFSSDRCDPELWSQTGNSASGKIGTVCNNSLDYDGAGTQPLGGCILKADNGTQVKVPWKRVTGSGLIYQFMGLNVKPRLGMMSFNGSSSPYINSDKVFLGDFLASNNNDATFPYLNLITAVNSQDASGNTPTGPAMWDALNYYSMNSPLYGGFTAQSGSGDRWRNPLYVCDGGGGNNCTLNTCARNYVLLMSDGEWNTPSSSIGSSPTCTSATKSSDPVVPAYCMHKGFTNKMSPSDATDDVASKVSAVYTVGLFMNSVGLQAMKNVAMYGSFESSAHTWPDSLTGFPTNGNGSLGAALPASSSDWDSNGDGVPDTFYSSDDAIGIKQNILNAVLDILSHATSGTAASVLASGEGSGANLVQATYYPRRRFFDTSISWIGGLQNLWYYIDPRFANSSIREDDGDKILYLNTDASHQDYMARFYFDTSEQKAKARLYSTVTSGVTTTVTEIAASPIEFEELGNLWEAGMLLWNRPATDRTIYTPLDTSQPLTASANKFSAGTPAPDNTAALRPLLNTDNASATAAINNQLAGNIINYVRGTDILSDYTYTIGVSTITESYRPRTVKIDLNGDNDASDTSVLVSGVTMDETVAKVWKLGDIIDSTPRISSWVPLNFYNRDYGDTTYSSYLSSATYTNRGMVYVGANDGMLHAFKLGTLTLKWSGQDTALEKAKLTGADLGKEMWAFIPRNVLPYLKYLKETDYCHIQAVDLTPYVFDSSINMPSGCTDDYWKCAKTVDSWRTIIIGGMRLGGACKAKDDNCSTNTPNGVCAPVVVGGQSVGYSSYFALDVTDQNNPQLLWEFSNPGLGFTTAGPAIIRISSRTAGATNSTADGGQTNGKWFVVLGSGPTGPIDTASQKFLGRSDQNLKLFILDLKTGSLLRTIDTGIQNAFAGSMLNTTFDNDKPDIKPTQYQDDALYIPYVKKCTATTAYCANNTWTDGGVLRLLTNKKSDGPDVTTAGTTALNPDNWRYSTVIDGIGPVTSSVQRLQNVNTGKLWLYFGTGRYFYRSGAVTDDANGQRHLFGIVEPCFDNNSYKDVCLDSVTFNDLTRTVSELGAVNLSTAAGSSDPDGWYIALDGSGNHTFDEDNNGTTANDVARSYNAERVITDPLSSTTGLVYFTTYMPYNDLCAIGGKSFIWAVKYDTGGADPSLLQGTALIQVSTGSIEQLNLATAFTDKQGRRSGAMEGVPPTSQGLSIMSSPSPLKKVLHIRER